MSTDDTVVIPLDKKKMMPIALGAAGFIALGAGLILASRGEPFVEALYVRLAGAASILFFGLVLVSVVPKLLDPRPGLTIGPDGIHDNSGVVSAGMIPWTEILGFDVTSVRSQLFLTIRLADPEKFLERGGVIQRLAKRANLKFYRSPVQLSARTLAIGFDELVALIEHRYQSRERTQVQGE